MEELNKKIAEWCGFKKVYNHTADVDWTYCKPDGTLYSFKGFPDFATSLDACFEYIVLKIDKNYDIYVSRHYDRPGFSCAIQNITKKPRFQPIFGSAETPALALCRAVEKLIDGGKE